MITKLVSIPVFVYNGEKFLKQQLDSLLNQTYKNIEIIVCDDGSTDKSLEIIKQYSKVNNLTYFTNEVNLGITKNVEKGLSLCKGDYIATCDHDDIWLPNKIELLVENIKDNLLIYSASIKIDENNNIIENSTDTFNKLSGACAKSLIIQNCVSGHTLMFKKELLDSILPFPKSYIHPDWWIAYVASSIGEIQYFNKVLVHYRQHSNQITKAKKQKIIEPISKYIYKLKQYKNAIQKRVEVLQALSSFKSIEKSNLVLIENLTKQTQNLNTSFRNKKLKNILLKKENNLLLIIPEDSRIKIANKLSRGKYSTLLKELSKILLVYIPVILFLYTAIKYLIQGFN